MTVTHYGNQYYRGLAADTKPVAAQTAINATFEETDTGKVYRNNGTAWRPEYLKNPASMIVFKDGTTYYAQEADGTIVSSSTTDASIPINYAINNIPGALANGYGGRVFIYAGKYTCLTGIAADFDVTGYHGVSIMGEGAGTQLIFEPISTLTNAILLRMLYPQLKDLLVWAKNANVVNVIKAGSPTAVAQYNWGLIENVSVNGRPSGIPLLSWGTIIPSTEFPTPGQTGLLLQGTHDANGYFTANWKVHNCEFFGLDTGVYVKGIYSDMCNHSNIHCGSCNKGYVIEGVQHNLVNFRIEGGGGSNADTVGDIGIWIVDPGTTGVGGTINMLDNINIELHKPGSIGILLDGEINNNQIGKVFHSSAEGMASHAIVSNRKDVGANYVFYPPEEPQNLSASRIRIGSANFGLCAQGKEHGILNGNLKYQLDGVDAPFTVTGSVNGPFMNLITTTVLSSVACVFYNNPLGNTIATYNYPSLYVKFRLNNTTNTRCFIGLIDRFTSPPNTNAEVLANQHGIGLFCDLQTSANWKIMHNNGAAASTVADFPTFTLGETTYGPAAVSTAQVYNLFVTFNNSNPSANVRLNGISYDYKTTGIPAPNTVLGFLIYCQNRNPGAARTLRLFDMEARIQTT